MHARLHANRRLTYIVAATVVLCMLTLAAVPLSSAGEAKGIEQRVRTAKTPADHKALAAAFQKEAQAAQRQATRHQRLKEAYAGQPNAQTMINHCDTIAKQYQEIAKELTSMAEMHKEMAAMPR